MNMHVNNEAGAAAKHRQNQIRSELLLRRLKTHHGKPQLPAIIIADALLAIGKAAFERRFKGIIDNKSDIDLIISTVASYFNIAESHILSHRRNGELTRRRHIAMFLVDEFTAFSYPAIGRAFKRDHSTTLYGIRRVKEQLTVDPVMSAQVSVLRAQLAEHFKDKSQLPSEQRHRRVYEVDNWPPHRVAMLFELRGQNLSFPEIARRLGGISKNACRERYNRLMEQAKQFQAAE